MIFKNHQTKLKTQMLIYCIIPAIFVFVYLQYPISHFRFFIWAGICIVSPIAGKLISGIKNYNDFLKLTNDFIQYKNNEKEATLTVREIQQIELIKDANKVVHKVQVTMVDQNKTVIDLDEMELEAYYKTIEEFMKGHYGRLLKKD